MSQPVYALILPLIVIPAVYSLWKEWELSRAEQTTPVREGDLPVAPVAHS